MSRNLHTATSQQEVISRTASERLLTPLKKITAEGVAIAVLSVGSVAVGVYGFIGSRDQDKGIKSSLSTEAASTIPGFSRLAIAGTMFNYSEGSLHDATVQLVTGAQCDIQFTTASGSGLISELAPDQAKIVSFGTCPTSNPR